MTGTGSGLGESYRVVGEMAESDSDSDMGSFIIIPRCVSDEEANSEFLGPDPSRGHPSTPFHGEGNSTSIMGRSSINVFELGQQAVRATCSSGSIPVELNIPSPTAKGSGAGPFDDKELSPSTLGDCAGEESETGICHSSGSMASNCTMASNISSVSEASSLEEANVLLNEFSMENRKLKDLLTTKNEKMKKDLDMYKSLQSSMLKMSTIDLEHKSKYEERLSIIQNLREEKEKLRLELDQKGQEVALFSALAEQSKQDAESEKKKVEELCSSMEQEVDHLTRQIDALNALLSQRDSEVEELKRSVERGEAELVEAQASAISGSEYKELQTERDMLSEAFEYSKTTIEQLNESRMERTLESNQLMEAMKAREDFIMRLQEELDHLRLNYPKLAEQAMRHEHTAFENERLRVVIEQLKQQVGIREKELGNARKVLTTVNEGMCGKDEEIRVLQTRLALLKTQEEETGFYKVQMEEYKLNFEAERNHCISVVEQKKELAKEVEQLKTELAKKRTELDNLHQAHLELATEHLDSLPDQSSMSSDKSDSSKSIPQQVSQVFDFVKREIFGSKPRKGSGSQGSPVSHDEASSPRAPQHPCPLCNRKFCTTDALISHASNCGEREPFVFP